MATPGPKPRPKLQVMRCPGAAGGIRTSIGQVAAAASPEFAFCVKNGGCGRHVLHLGIRRSPHAARRDRRGQRSARLIIPSGAVPAGHRDGLPIDKLRPGFGSTIRTKLRLCAAATVAIHAAKADGDVRSSVR